METTVLPEQILQRDIDFVREDLRTISRAIEAARSTDLPKWCRDSTGDHTSFCAFADRMLNTCGCLDKVLEQLATSTPQGEFSSYGMYLLVSVQFMSAEVEALASRCGGSQAGVEAQPDDALTKDAQVGILGFLKSGLTPTLRKLVPGVLKVLAGLMTPKAWKVEGSIGSDLMGLAQAKIEIEFGK